MAQMRTIWGVAEFAPGTQTQIGHTWNSRYLTDQSTRR